MESTDKKNLIRLNKFIAKWGEVSRRKAEEMIKAGEVFVNGKKISHLSVFVDPEKDIVKFKKQKIFFRKTEPLYLMFNKPQKVLTTNKDPKGRPIVMDYIRKYKGHLFPVGRLDWDSEGLLILTNDGEFTNKILHPKNKIPKTYIVKVNGCPKEFEIKKLIKGVSTPIGKKRALFAKLSSKKSLSNTWVKIIIHEGKNDKYA